MCWGNARCTSVAVFLLAAGLGMYSRWSRAHARVRTCPCQCIYLMLTVGNVHVTVRNYECGVRGAVFRHVLTAEACFFKLSEPRRCCSASCCLSKAALETKLPGWGGHGTASEWNVPSWFKVQSPEPEGPRDHSRPPTHAPSILLPTFLRFHLGLPA